MNSGKSQSTKRFKERGKEVLGRVSETEKKRSKEIRRGSQTQEKMKAQEEEGVGMCKMYRGELRENGGCDDGSYNVYIDEPKRHREMEKKRNL